MPVVSMDGRQFDRFEDFIFSTKGERRLPQTLLVFPIHSDDQKAIDQINQLSQLIASYRKYGFSACIIPG